MDQVPDEYRIQRPVGAGADWQASGNSCYEM
jgi:hypothetical protein